MKNSKFTISQHAIDRYIARIAPGTNWEKARHTLERRVRQAKRCHGNNPRQRYKSDHDSTRYYQHHDLVFAVDIDAYTVVTIFRRAWLHSNNTATPLIGRQENRRSWTSTTCRGRIPSTEDAESGFPLLSRPTPVPGGTNHLTRIYYKHSQTGYALSLPCFV